MIRRLASDRSGVALVEFAVTLPFLIALYFGSFQLCDAISAYRKVTTTTRALADLTSQYTQVSDTDLDTILGASQQIMTPYSYQNAKITITQVKIDASGNSTVEWSRGMNINGLTPGATFNVPASIKVNGTYLLVASTDYTYVPVVAPTLFGNIAMHDQIILSPRASASVKHLT